MSTVRRAVLLGGTFDPIHLGHLAVAGQARARLEADEVWLIPSNSPPHRRPALAAAADRLAMVRAAAAGDPHLRVLDLEISRGGPSYTLDTVAELAARHPETEQWFLLGADAAREIGGWHGLGDLLRVARFVLVNREGVGELTVVEAEALGFDRARLRVIGVTSPPISATDVRLRVARGEPVTGLVPDAVARIIAERGLYGGAVTTRPRPDQLADSM